MPNFKLEGLNLLAEQITQWRKDKGFHTPDSISRDVDREELSVGYFNPEMVLAKLALVHSEISEMLEAIRSEDEKNFAKELADTIIRLLDLAGSMGINIEHEISEKMITNLGRPEKHGRSTLV